MTFIVDNISLAFRAGFCDKPSDAVHQRGISLKSFRSSFTQLFYGWRMVGLVSALRVLGGGLHNYGFTVFFLPLSQDLGLSRAATSLAFSLARVEGAIEGPFVGYLIDRFGPRPMILIAALYDRSRLHPVRLGRQLRVFPDCLSRHHFALVRARASSTRRWRWATPGSSAGGREP